MTDSRLCAPPEILQALHDLTADSLAEHTIAELLQLGEGVLRDHDEGRGGEHQSLAMAIGDGLFYGALLVIAQHDLKKVSDQVWALEEEVHGRRPAEPPTEIPADLPALAEIALPASGDDDEAALETLCYGIATRQATTVPASERMERLSGAMSRFAARKFALFTAQKERQRLQFRSAGLRGLLDGRRRSEEIRRSRSRVPAGGESSATRPNPPA